MPVISNKPLPEGHPLKRGLIVFGQKRPNSSEEISPKQKEEPANGSLKQQVKSLPLNGKDPVLEFLSSRGLPLTRTNYLKYAGLELPLEAEHQAYLDSLNLES